MWQRKNLIVEFLFVAFPKVLNGVGWILINVLAVQALGPSLFGIFYLCSQAILLTDGVLGSAFDMGVVRLVPGLQSSDPAKASNTETAALMLKFAIAGSISLILVPFASPLANVAFDLPSGGNLIQLTCIAAIAVLALRSVQVHLQVNQRFASYGALDLLTSVIRIGGVIAVLYLSGPNLAYLLVALAIAPAFTFTVGIATLARGLLRLKPAFWEATKEFASYVKWPLLTFCITTVAAKVDLLLLTAWGTIAEVGLFSAGQVLTMIPELLGMYLAIVVSPKIMPAIQAGSFPAMLQRFQLAALVFAAAGLVAGLACLGLIGDYFLPGEYRRSVTILAILLPGALLSMANFPLVVPTLMFVRPRALIVIELVLLAPLLVVYYVAITRFGAEGAAVVTSLSRTFKAILQLAVAWQFRSSLIDNRASKSPVSGPST